MTLMRDARSGPTLGRNVRLNSAAQNHARKAPLTENLRAKSGQWRKVANSLVGFLAVVLAASLISAVLVGLLALHAWYKHIHYDDGLANHCLSVGAVLILALTGALLWECRNVR